MDTLQNKFMIAIVGFLAMIIVLGSVKAGVASVPINDKSDAVYINNECMLKEWKVSDSDIRKYGGSDEAVKAKNMKPVRVTPCLTP